MRALPAVMLLACAPSYDRQLARIEERLVAIDRRAEAAERHAMSASSAASAGASSAAVAATAAAEAASACNKAPAKPPAAWSCAANCLKSFNCSTNASSTVKWVTITSTGASAADAFKALENQCSDEMYVDGRCLDGKFVRTAATILKACTRN